jgi:hypothetical protein
MTDDEIRAEIWRFHKVLPVCPEVPAHDCTFMVKSPGLNQDHYCSRCLDCTPEDITQGFLVNVTKSTT